MYMVFLMIYKSLLNYLKLLYKSVQKCMNIQNTNMEAQGFFQDEQGRAFARSLGFGLPFLRICFESESIQVF